MQFNKSYSFSGAQKKPPTLCGCARQAAGVFHRFRNSSGVFPVAVLNFLKK